MPVQTDGCEDYKGKYKILKRKLKILIYESECFQEELRKSQRALLKVRRDKSFLLDRLLQYQQGPESSSDSEQTEESDPENDSKNDMKKRRLSTETSGSVTGSSMSGSKPSHVSKKKKSSHHSSSSSAGGGGGGSNSKSSSHSKHMSKTGHVIANKNSSNAANNRQAMKSNLPNALISQQGTAVIVGSVNSQTDGQMSREELERHLAARQPISDFSTTVSLTVPNQLFSDSNIMDGDLLEDEIDTSPGNLDDDITIDNYE